MKEIAYTAPSDEIFNEVRDACIEIWGEIAQEPTYLKEKTGIVNKMGNYRDNIMTMIWDVL